MNKTEFRSEDGKFGLILSGPVIKEIFARCENAGRYEIGSILVGHYTRRNSVAVVTDLPATPPDSIAGPVSFERGTKGLRRLLKRLWKKRRYYLGEWHYHPHAEPTASGQDHRQMREFAADRRYACPEPILLIVGGSAPDWSVSVYVYPQGQARQMHEVLESS